MTEAAEGPKESILRRAAIGTGWIVAWRMATRALGLISTLVLIRLLSPGDFGLVALATSFITAVDTLSALGIEDALVREHAPTADMYDTAFTMTALRGLVTTLVIAAGALPVSRFFADPRLAVVLWALAGGVLIQSLNSVGIVDFRRDMAFHREFVLQIQPRLVSVAVTIGIAAVWHSYWALIGGILTARTLRAIVGYRMHGWRPRFTLSAWRQLIGFSLWSWAISIVELARDRVDMFVVGRAISPAAVGTYAIAEEVSVLPSTEVVLPLCRAVFSAFSTVRRVGGNLQEAMIRPVAATFLVIWPAGLGISLIADPLVRLVMGQKWVSAIPVIELLGVMSGLTAFGLIGNALMSAYAALRPMFAITAGALCARIILLVVLVSRLGLIGGAIGAFAGMVIEHALLVSFIFRNFDIQLRELVSRTWRIAVSGLVMAGILWFAGLGWSEATGDAVDLPIQLASRVACGIAAYAIALATLWVLSGRPDGAEADVLAILAQPLRRVGLTPGVLRRRGILRR